MPLLQHHNGFTLPRPKLYTGMIASTFVLLSDSHGEIYNMRDWDNLQVPALAYDSLV